MCTNFKELIKHFHVLTYDPDFKEIFAEIVHDDVGTKLIKSIKVGTLPLEIDAIIEFSHDSTFKFLQPIRNIRELTAARRLVIEYKGPTDSLSKNNLRKLIAYRELYLIEKDPNEVTPTALVVISTKLPRKLLAEMDATELAQGLHHVELSGQLIFVISINALDVSKDNYGLLVFSSSKKQIEEFVTSIIDNNYQYFENKPLHHKNIDEERFLSYVIKLDFETVHRVAKKRGLNMSIVLDNIMKAIDHFGLKRVIDEVGLKRVIDEVGLKRVVDEVGLKRVVDEVGLKRVVDEVGMENLLEVLRADIHDEETLKVLDELIRRLDNKSK